VLGNFAPWCDVPLSLKVSASVPSDDLIAPFLANEALSQVDFGDYDAATFRPPETHVRALENKSRTGMRRRRRCKRLTSNAMETVVNSNDRLINNDHRTGRYIH